MFGKMESRLFYFVIVLALFFSPCVLANQLKLWYSEPAKQWFEALPVGNGRLGAMIYGGIEGEHIQLNEDTVWSGR